MPEDGSPTVRRRELGAILRKLRVDSGLTVEQVAEQLLCSPSKISRLETGHRGASTRDIRDLCDLFQVVSERRDYLTTLAREGTRKAWWQPYDLPYATYVGLESAAVTISDFEPGVFPGLLQTPAYARAVHEAAFPLLSPEVIDQRIEVRRARQQALVRDKPPQLAAIVDEAVLHRVVGGPDVMVGQLVHVIEASQLDNITVQVLPYSAGAHPALGSLAALPGSDGCSSSKLPFASQKTKEQKCFLATQRVPASTGGKPREVQVMVLALKWPHPGAWWRYVIPRTRTDLS